LISPGRIGRVVPVRIKIEHNTNVILCVIDPYKELFACRDYHVWSVEVFDQWNLFESVHREIVEDLWLNLFEKSKQQETMLVRD
jgi:hypothetical protein